MFKFSYKQIDFSHAHGYFGDTLKDTSVHNHDFNELIYFVGGDVNYIVGSRSFHLKNGDVVYTPKNTRHIVEIYNSSPYEMYTLKFSDNVLPHVLAERLSGREPFIGNQKKLYPQFSGLSDYYNNFSDEELYEIYVCELIKTLIFLFKTPSSGGNQQNEFITSILTYIDENITSTLTAEGISDYLGFSKSYISNEFKKHVKMPLMTYVRQKKILAAHDMLLAGKKKLEVAESLGFKDYSTFYRAYIKIMGFKPE